LFELNAIGARIATKVTAPGIASTCAAGPTRTCQNNRPIVAAAGSAAPSVRRRRSGSPRRCHASAAQPTSPAVGSAMMIRAIRQPC